MYKTIFKLRYLNPSFWDYIYFCEDYANLSIPSQTSRRRHTKILEHCLGVQNLIQFLGRNHHCRSKDHFTLRLCYEQLDAVNICILWNQMGNTYLKPHHWRNKCWFLWPTKQHLCINSMWKKNRKNFEEKRGGI